ncbi:MAG: hypothetical protein KDD52_00190 [Bdellovibrionales bacterium]|nr:hypothetical protein [Bdellovibrionales bacterium]
MSLTRFQDVEQIEKDLEKLSASIEELKIKYEQYFIGLNKEEPAKLRDKVQSMARNYYGLSIQNAGLKFRYQQAIAKYNTYSTLWDRTLKRIEEGTYERDLFKARIRSSAYQQGAQSHRSEESSDDGPSKQELNQLYQEYQEAAGKKLDFVSFRQNIAPKIMAIKERTQDKDVQIRIVREGAKIRVKAYKKKS